jgi:hypothetical protein
MKDRYEFSQKAKRFSIGLMIIGVLALIVGIITAGGGHEGAEGAGHHASPYQRIWANILINNLFFLGLALAAGFFIAVNYLANTGWHILIKRVPEAMTAFIPWIFVPMLLVFFFGGHDLYHWLADGIMVEGSETYDKIIAGKGAYLNTGFFVIRMVVYFALWTYLAWQLRRLSTKEDIEGGLENHKRSITFSAIYIVFFAISTSTASWDWIMSIDTHWYSTLFGWYFFASIFVSGMTAITLFVVYLKRMGYMEQVNGEHMHDLGKYMFAFSVFWTYLWFDQFMLQWYANIPEETWYFYQRLENYNVLFWATFILNFILPFLILMTRNSKRTWGVVLLVGGIILIGHWFDFFLMIMPGTVGAHWHLGFVEFGLLLGYAGMFIFSTLNALTKASLIPKNSPYLEESIHHEST